MIHAHLVPTEEVVSIRSSDGAELAGRLMLPEGDISAVAVLHPATGVPARFYAPFARWLAGARGVACLIYDYRDFGASGSARGSNASMTDWGVHDQQAARDWLQAAFPEAPLWVIGHSLGGMMLPYQDGLDGIDRVIMVASGAVHVSEHPWPYQAFARLFWAPGLAALADRLGYLPLQAIGIGKDIPARVYRQWRSWCLSRDFHDADPDLQAPDASLLTCEVRFVAVADDELCPPSSVWKLMQRYGQAWKRQHVIVPADHGLRKVGHLDVLGEKGRAVWAAVLDG